MKETIVDYCTAIGADPLLVQGAGGNVSWKDGDKLWIKASGTWLSDASKKDIFVPVALSHLRQAISTGDFTVSPKPCGESGLRPSIETLLHALMPHPVVVHLHAVEILAHLVRHGFERAFSLSLDSNIRWSTVDYHKPGAELARAVHAALLKVPDADVVFLKNHGVVIGSSDIAGADAILNSLVGSLQTSPRVVPNCPVPDFRITIAGKELYSPIQDRLVHQLATDTALFDRLESDWALYPDHVVFLGAKPYFYNSIDSLKTTLEAGGISPELVFVQGVGVFVLPGFSMGKHAQLRCYYDVLTRQEEGMELDSLNHAQIADLLDWDAEKYRMHLAQ